MVRFRTLERWQNKGYLGRSEIPQGLDVLVQGQAAGQVVPVSSHHIHQARWQQGGHILGDGRGGREGRESETPKAIGWVRSELPGRAHGVHEQCKLGWRAGAMGTGVAVVTRGWG